MEFSLFWDTESILRLLPIRGARALKLILLYTLITFKEKNIFSLNNRAHKDLNCLEKEAHIFYKF